MTTPASRTERYDTLSIAFHWLTLLVLVATFATIELRIFFEKGTPGRDEIKAWHFALGVLILFVTLARIANRIARRAEAPAPLPGPDWRHRAARIMHWSLYAMLIVLPLLGWVATNAAGKPVPFFLGLTMPVLSGPDKEFGASVEELHEFLGGALYVMIGLHAAAAILHRVVLKHPVFARMMPCAGANAGDLVSGRAPAPGSWGI